MAIDRKKKGNYLQKLNEISQMDRGDIIRYSFPFYYEQDAVEDYRDRFTRSKLSWSVLYSDPDIDKPRVIASGTHLLAPVVKTLQLFSKWKRRRKEKLADVYLDESSLKLLELLNKETSIKWENLIEEAGLKIPEILRGIAILTSAELCESGPIRLRLSDLGEMMVSGKHKEAKAESVQDGEHYDIADIATRTDEYSVTGTW